MDQPTTPRALDVLRIEMPTSRSGTSCLAATIPARSSGNGCPSSAVMTAAVDDQVAIDVVLGQDSPGAVATPTRTC